MISLFTCHLLCYFFPLLTVLISEDGAEAGSSRRRREVDPGRKYGIIYVE